VTAIVNNKEGMKGGRMNFIQDEKKLPHTIINIASDGVYIGVCIYYFFIFYSFLYYFLSLIFTQFSSVISSFTISVTSLRKLRIPSSCIVDDERKCVGYDFKGGFKNYSLNFRDENGQEIFNIKKYFKGD
jgi:hypothetical protein